MNKSKVQPFSGGKSSDAFSPPRRHRSVEKHRNRIARYPERPRTRAFASLEGFRMYTHYGCVGVIPTQRVYQLSDNDYTLFSWRDRVAIIHIQSPTSLHHGHDSPHTPTGDQIYLWSVGKLIMVCPASICVCTHSLYVQSCTWYIPLIL